MTTEPSIKIQVLRHFDATPERVFDAWITPTQAGKFLFSTATGEIVRVDLDARVGGSFTIVDCRDGNDVAHVGEYLVLERPRRLAFKFCVPQYSKDMTRVTLDFTPSLNGCELTLTHDMHPDWAEYKARTEEGWKGILTGLAKVLGETSAG